MQIVVLVKSSPLQNVLKKDLRFFARAAYERRQSTSNRAKSMKRFSFAYLILSGLASSSLSVMAGPGIAYPDPPGGWTYILDGSQAAPGTASAAFYALDGTWNAVNGSRAWSRDGVGGTLSNTNPP